MEGMDRLVEERTSMGLEIDKYLTDIKANFYFDKINKLKGTQHKKAFIESCKFVFLMFKSFIDKDLYVSYKAIKLEDCKFFNIDKNGKIFINKEHFFEQLESILNVIYELDSFEFIFKTDKFCINIYTDPVDINIYYSDEIYKIKECNKNFKNIFF